MNSSTVQTNLANLFTRVSPRRFSKVSQNLKQRPKQTVETFENVVAGVNRRETRHRVEMQWFHWSIDT